MKNQFAQTVLDINESVTTGPGETDAALRAAITQYASDLTLDQTTRPEAIPDELLPYMNKVIRHAYKTTDADVEHLKRQGYTEDQLFELTISAAFGAGNARYQKGLSLLNQK